MSQPARQLLVATGPLLAAAALSLSAGCGLVTGLSLDPQVTVGASDVGPVEAGGEDGRLHDGGVGDAGQRDHGAADTMAPDLGIRDSVLPDTRLPDTNLPDTNLPDTTRPDTTLPDAAPAPWYDTGLPCRIEIQLADTALSTVLYSFPLMVPVARGYACSGEPIDPAKLRFIDGDGNALPFEQERSTAAQPFVFWVRLLQINPAVGADHIFLYFGAEPSTPAAALEWAEPYRGVWHLADDMVDNVAYDSSTWGHHATAVSGMGVGNSEVGQVGYALRFHNDAGRLAIGDPPDDRLDFGASDSFTWSLWVRVSQAVGNSDIPWSKGGSTLFEPGYQLQLGQGAWGASLSDGSIAPWGAFGDASAMANRWVFLTAVVDRVSDQLRVYVDGEETDQQPLNGVQGLSSTRSATIGASDQGGEPFVGLIDELRVEATPRTADWIKAEYLSVSGQLAQLGQVEDRP